tara:strand:- start:596 stop:781 length:186 start_codon:yes stop_codon:yes gene_type:complete
MVGNPRVPTFIDEQERQLEAYRRIRHRRQRVNAVIREAGMRFLIGGSAGQYTKWLSALLPQ